jgi:hypothetical protein
MSDRQANALSVRATSKWIDKIAFVFDAREKKTEKPLFVFRNNIWKIR